MTDQEQPLTSLPFPPVTRQHILNCSYHSWYPRLRSATPKARIIPLSNAFLDYLRADGIILPSDSPSNSDDTVDDSGYSDSDNDDDSDEDEDVASNWREIHEKVISTITELGCKVVPKLNWSAPKDATWMSATNDMECRSANDVYLLLKSSDFITHDLEQAFDGCVTQPADEEKLEIPFHLVLRKSFNLNPSLEFRCFVRNRTLIAISQREMNYFDFLFDLRRQFQLRIEEFLEMQLLPNFGDESFVFDVYLPPPHDKVWLIDINPWAPRTDPLLFSWLELLTMHVPEQKQNGLDEGFVRFRIGEVAAALNGSNGLVHGDDDREDSQETDGSDSEDEEEEEEEEEDIFDPEFRLVQRDDPEAYQFSATKYSAHKLPKDVVDASMTPGGMKDMMEEWKKVMDKDEERAESSDDGATV